MLSIGVWGKIVQSAPKINRFPFNDFFSAYISFATSSELPSNMGLYDIILPLQGA